MKSFPAAPLLGLLFCIGSVRAETAVDIRLMKADPATAGFIRSAVEERRFAATELEDRLDQLMTGGKVTELARFRQAAIASGMRIEFKKDAGEAEVADGEKMPMGITLEIESTFDAGDTVNMRFAFSNQQSVRKNQIEVDHTMSSAMVTANAWEVISAWGDASESMLLMAHFSGDAAKGKSEGEANGLREVFCDGELILCDANDLKTFGRATPSNRAKAVGWLRERGELVARSGLRVNSGQRATQKDSLDWIHDANGWESAQLGMVMDLQAQVGPFGESVDLDVSASWSPRDTPKPPAAPFAEFRHADTTASGSTLVIEAKTRPDKGPVPVLFLTPHIRTLREGNPGAGSRPDPKPGGISSRFYFVHPSFLRKIAARGGAQANADPQLGLPPRPLKALLEEMGMPFPVGTQISFIPSDCRVLLNHDAKGHALFQSIINQLGLAVPDRTAE